MKREVEELESRSLRQCRCGTNVQGLKILSKAAGHFWVAEKALLQFKGSRKLEREPFYANIQKLIHAPRSVAIQHTSLCSIKRLCPKEHDPRALSKEIDFPNLPRSETVSNLTNSTASYASITQQPQISLSAQSTHELLPQSLRLQTSLRSRDSPGAFRRTTHTAERADFLPPRMGNISGWTQRAVSPSLKDPAFFIAKHETTIRPASPLPPPPLFTPLPRPRPVWE
ncbi:hypothetical protein F5879DRAFT_1030513 [Lentinula edodes]|nr:hypothetical protein F5879DRAFT_1030513 [Lentinula edodes]